MCLKTTRQWLRWLSKEGVPQWDMFPEPTELLLIGYSIESIWTQNPNQVHRYLNPTRIHTDPGKFHTWWMESSFVFVQYQPFQFYSLFWSDGKKNTTRFRRRTSHSKIETNDELYCKGAIERIILDFSKPREEKLWKTKSLECESWERGKTGATRCGQRPKRPHLTIIMNNLLKALSQHATQSGMITKRGILKSGKLTLRCVSRSGQPVVTSWGETRESQSSFFHEKTQHVGTAHSIVNEEIPRDRPGQPVVYSQREARPQQFTIGDDETELELTVESRSFVNRVNDQVRKETKTIFDDYCRKRRKAFYDIGNVHVCNNGISSIHGKELPEHLSFRSRIQKTSHWNKCSTYLQDWCLNKMRSLDWRKLVGKIIHGNACLWLVKKELSIFSAQKSTSFQILYCVFVRYTRIPNLTVHGKTDWDGSNHLRNKETLTESTVSRWTSSGIFSQDSIRCSSMTKSNVCCWN